MKQIDLSDHTILSDDEKALLLMIYKSRLRLFVGAFFTLFMMGILYGQRIDSRSIKFGERRADVVLSRSQMKWAGILWLEIPILSVAGFVFSRRINCLKKDVADGNKYRIYYQVQFKQYFPMTNQYFISLDDPDYMHHEVDAQLFAQVNEQDAFPVHITRYARYAFNRNGSFTIL
jgi:hypothetical protein